MEIQERQEIRKIYKEMYKHIKFHYPLQISPYFFNWTNYFSTIEYNVWCGIRFLCLPFYPEYPVGKYFIDFADPINKIGIEVDGKKYHQDFAKDRSRQKEIEKEGWKIYRIKGRNTFDDCKLFSVLKPLSKLYA